MKIKLFRGDVEVCTLDGGPVPKELAPHVAALKILEYFQEGDWIWIDRNTRGVRLSSITDVRVVDEGAPQPFEEKSIIL